MEVIIVRHGQSEADLLNVYEGRANYNLTELGNKQAKCLGDYIGANYKVVKIYSSTLNRAKQTAEYISKATGVDIIFDEGLMEWNNGLLAGLSREEANRLYPEMKDVPVDKSIYNQESKLQFRERAEAFIKRLLIENEEDKTIVVVTHGGMINELYCSLLDIPVGKKIGFGTDDTGLHVWRLMENKFFVIKANSTEHLKN